MGWDPWLGPWGRTVRWDHWMGPYGETMDWDPGVRLRKTLEWNSNLSFHNILNHTVFFITLNYKKFKYTLNFCQF